MAYTVVYLSYNLKFKFSIDNIFTMKIIQTFIIFLFITFHSRAQNFHLDSFYKANTNWSEINYFQAGQGQSGGSVYRLKILRDSLVANQKYWLIQREEVGHFSNNDWANPPNSFFYNSYHNSGLIGGIRVDSEKVYFRKWSNLTNYSSFAYDVDTLIYDFGLQVGDTFAHLSNKVVLTKDSIQIQSGQWFQRIVFQSFPGSLINDYWLKGIGSNHGFLMSFLDAYPQNSIFNFLKCFEQDSLFIKNLNGLFFKEPVGDECLFISTKIDLPICYANEINIFPNPSKDIFTIFNSKKDVDFNIINQLGQQCYSGKLVDKTTQIDLSFLPNGIYFLKTKTVCLKLVKG